LRRPTAAPPIAPSGAFIAPDPRNPESGFVRNARRPKVVWRAPGKTSTNDGDYCAAMNELEGLMAADPDTPQGRRFDELVALIDDYEGAHPSADAAMASTFR
jgi:hypothetical protein